MGLFQMVLAAAGGFWAQTQPTTVPENAQGAVPYTRIVDMVLPNVPVMTHQDFPIQAEAVIDAGTVSHRQFRAEVWGLVGIKAYYFGDRMAPNGIPYQPLFALGSNFNLGILPDQKLYLFIDTTFWGQKADWDAGISNPRQGSWDFSKREFDMNIGFAWNYHGPWEFRAFAYAYNNLNRGTSPALPSGYNDGVGLENRYYLPAVDKYDVAKRSFLSVGYYPSKTMISGDGQEFSPGFFARAYLTRELPWWNSYLYLDSQLISEQVIKARLFNFDGGLGIRPFPSLQSLEFRLGFTDNYDIQGRSNQLLGYGAFQILF